MAKVELDETIRVRFCDDCRSGIARKDGHVWCLRFHRSRKFHDPACTELDEREEWRHDEA